MQNLFLVDHNSNDKKSQYIRVHLLDPIVFRSRNIVTMYFPHKKKYADIYKSRNSKYFEIQLQQQIPEIHGCKLIKKNLTVCRKLQKLEQQSFQYHNSSMLCRILCVFVGGFLLSSLGGVADKRKCDMCYAGNIEKITTRCG